MTDETEGTVYSLSGRRYGRTASIEETFCRAAEYARNRDGTVYVVLGPDSTPSFRERCEAICPVVVDEDADGVALIVAGVPADWQALRDAP